MRLLDTSTLEVVETNEQNPNYAILSHTVSELCGLGAYAGKWDDDEISFQEIQNPNFRDLDGYDKIKNSTALARLHGFEYIWIDTCNIDKTSSAELSEAINSMYKWYKEAQVCYVYLSDMDGHDLDAHNCRWFNRGWTLQELIAPSSVLFYNRHWEQIGSKASLRRKISEKTRIPYSVLLGYDDSCVSIADKMKWAAGRKTTRPEDLAYCLMGLFDVNMPIIYGEGKKAFHRLQQEIIRSSNDHTIFAWTSAEGSVHTRDLFANDASDFLRFSEHYGSIQQRSANSRRDLPYYMTNIGLRCQLPFRKAVDASTCAWVLLDCQVVKASAAGNPPLPVLMGLDNTNDDHYVRNGRFLSIDYDGDLSLALPLSDLVIKQSTGPSSFYGATIMQNPYISYPEEEILAPGRFRFLAKYPPYDSPNPTGPDGRLNSVDQPKVIGVAYSYTDGFEISDRQYFTVVVGFGRGSPWCDIRPFRVPPRPRETSYFDFYTTEIVAALSEYDKETLEESLLYSDRLSDRATNQLGRSNIHASVRRAPRGFQAHSRDSEVYILRLEPTPIP